ncbi:MAG: C40 family peptidase [Thiothrix sp.]|nr:C40 family peptidase [Thiothrix sp.]
MTRVRIRLITAGCASLVLGFVSGCSTTAPPQTPQLKHAIAKPGDYSLNRASFQTTRQNRAQDNSAYLQQLAARQQQEATATAARRKQQQEQQQAAAAARRKQQQEQQQATAAAAHRKQQQEQQQAAATAAHRKQQQAAARPRLTVAATTPPAPVAAPAPTPAPTPVSRTQARNTLTRADYQIRYQVRRQEQEKQRAARERKQQQARQEREKQQQAQEKARRQQENGQARKQAELAALRLKYREQWVQQQREKVYAAKQQNQKVEAVINKAEQQIGRKYTWGGASPQTGFDCSGLVKHSLQAGANIEVPRTAAEQYQASVKVPAQSATRGDLVFFRTSGSSVSHVGIYLGEGRFVHAPRAGRSITTDSISGYWKERLVSFGRIPGACKVPIPRLPA